MSIMKENFFAKGNNVIICKRIILKVNLTWGENNGGYLFERKEKWNNVPY